MEQFLPRSSGSMASPCPCGVDDISALRKKPFRVSATRVRPKPGDLPKFSTFNCLFSSLLSQPSLNWKGLHLHKEKRKINTSKYKHVYFKLHYCPCETSQTYSLARVDSLHVVSVDVNVWQKLVENTPGWLHYPVCHLGRNSHRIAVFWPSRTFSFFFFFTIINTVMIQMKERVNICWQIYERSSK